MSIMLVEKAIHLDQHGNSKVAVSFISDAIVLSPNEPMRWQSLGVILKNLNLKCAMVAFAINSMLDKQKPIA